MDTASRAHAIRDDLTPHLSKDAVVVDDVSIRPAGRRRMVRVSLARDVAHLLQQDTTSAVPALSLDEVAQAARTTDEVLETSDLVGPGPYTLEVSSAGVDQPLDSPERFRRNVGRLVEVVDTSGASSTRRLVAAGTDGIRLSDDPEVTMPYAEVAKATVQIEFTRPDVAKDS